MLIALTQKGVQTSLSSVRRAMRRGNLLKPNRRSPDGLTKADKKAQRPQNLLKRNFAEESPSRVSSAVKNSRQYLTKFACS